jgi:Fe-S-cluster containining protein
MIPCREVKKEEAHVTKYTPLKVIQNLADTPCRSHNCTKCCEYGTGTALPEDLEHIAEHFGMTVEEVKEKYFDPITKFNTTHYRPKMAGEPYGPCVFLTKEGCSIHPVRPTGCKLSSWNHHGEKLNEWFTLNYFVNVADPVSLKEWAHRLRFKSTIPGGQIHELVPNEEKRKKLMEN